MKLENKKELAARALGVGKGRIIFNSQRLNEVKEAITKQDMRDLEQDGAIMVAEISGRKKVEKRKGRRRQGSIRKKLNDRKAKYIIITRKLRAYVEELRKHETINKEQHALLRREIRARKFRSKAQLKEHLAHIKK